MSFHIGAPFEPTLSPAAVEMFGSKCVNERTETLTNKHVNKHDELQYLLAEVTRPTVVVVVPFLYYIRTVG